MALSPLTKSKLVSSFGKTQNLIDDSWMGASVKPTTAPKVGATVVPKAPVAPAPVAPAPVSTPTQDSSWIGTFPAKGTPKNTTNPAVPSQTGTTPPNPIYTDFSQKTD